jgi:hypothetical protein
LIRVGLFLLAIGGLFGAGWFAGVNHCESSHRATELVRADEQKTAEVQRQIAEAARLRAAQELEDLAYADPVNDSCGISAERVRRLNLR